MRTYYIFYINNYFTCFYQNKPYTLYKMLEQIYQLNKSDFVLGFKLYQQIALPFNKKEVNDYIYNKHEHDYYYRKNVSTHFINNHYSMENTKLIVNNSHLKIKTNINYSLFFDTINEYSSNIFICDFTNHDYFWISKIKENALVKV